MISPFLFSRSTCGTVSHVASPAGQEPPPSTHTPANVQYTVQIGHLTMCLSIVHRKLNYIKLFSLTFGSISQVTTLFTKHRDENFNFRLSFLMKVPTVNNTTDTKFLLWIPYSSLDLFLQQHFNSFWPKQNMSHFHCWMLSRFHSLEK